MYKLPIEKSKGPWKKGKKNKIKEGDRVFDVGGDSGTVVAVSTSGTIHVKLKDGAFAGTVQSYYPEELTKGKNKLPLEKSKGPWKKGKVGNLKKRKELENKYLGKRMKTMFGSGKVVSIGEDPKNFIAIVEDKDGYYEEVVLDSKF